MAKPVSRATTVRTVSRIGEISNTNGYHVYFLVHYSDDFARILRLKPDQDGQVTLGPVFPITRNARAKPPAKPSP